MESDFIIKNIVPDLLGIVFIFLDLLSKNGWIGNGGNKTINSNGEGNGSSKNIVIKWFGVICIIFMIISLISLVKKKNDISSVRSYIKSFLLNDSGPQSKTLEEISQHMSALEIGKEDFGIAIVEMMRNGDIKYTPYEMRCNSLNRKYTINIYYPSSKFTRFEGKLANDNNP